MRSDEPETIDRLMEDALSTYSSQEPRPGLEQRVLSRVHSAGAARRFAFPLWAFAVPVAACLLLTAIFWIHRGSQPQHSTVARTTAGLPAPVALRGRAETPRIVVRPHKSKRTKASVLPRLPEFPTPVRITREERTLLALVARAPDEARQAFMEMQQRCTESIRIDEIKIQPLQSNGLQ
jgi:hypothetical protein